MLTSDAIPAPLGSDETLPIMNRSLDEVRFADAPGMPPVQLVGKTDVGLKRERNEDHFVIGELQRWLRISASSMPTKPNARASGGVQGVVLAVADGMGGHGGGDVASAVALDSFLQYAAYLMPWGGSMRADDEQVMTHELSNALEMCQTRLWHVATRKGIAGLDPGTTLTVAYVAWPTMYVLHAGDSRCYVLRDGQLEQLTRDHTLAQELTDRGDLDGPPSPHFQHVLCNAIGGGRSRLDPEVHRYELRRGDTVLLCTDGVSGQVTDEALAAALSTDNATTACDQLIALANAAGGKDNATVVLARF